MKSSIKRLAKDQIGLRKALPPNYLFEDAELGQSLPDDLTHLSICLAGPEGTPYSQGLWHLRLDIPLEYPQSPPTATFRTRIFHPNVAEETGAVCLETLKRDWDPKLTLKDILITISCLLIHPNPDSALNQKAGALIQDDYEAFARQARLMAKIHAPIPDQLRTSAAEARRRGEEAETHQSAPNHRKTHTSVEPTDSIAQKENLYESSNDLKHTATRPPKRSIDQHTSLVGSSQDATASEERRRKSPKHHHQSTDCAEPGSRSDMYPSLESREHIALPEKVVFRAQWSLGPNGTRTKARIGIRRL